MKGGIESERQRSLRCFEYLQVISNSDMLELTCKRTCRPRKWNKQAMASQHQGRSCGPKSAFHFLGLACCHTISDGGMRSLVCTWRKHF